MIIGVWKSGGGGGGDMLWYVEDIQDQLDGRRGVETDLNEQHGRELGLY